MVPAPVTTCLHPIRVPYGGGYQYVSCGRCKACRKSFHSKWRNRLTAHQSSSAATLFITLTYAPEHLPRVTLDPDTLDISLVTYTRFTRGRRFSGLGDPKYERSIYTRFDDIDPYYKYIYANNPDKYHLKDIPHYISNGYEDPSPSFAICLRKDVQDFIKRLRILLSRDPDLVGRDTSFTYFICSEYGPKTYRPHYHGLLFFRDSYTASLCYSHYVSRAWKKSNLPPDQANKECQWVSYGDVAPYVSKYVTCDSLLPSFLDTKYFRPFHLSSHSSPIGSEVLPMSSISHTVRKTNLLHRESIKDPDTGEYVAIDMPYPSSLWARYFPKFLFHSVLSPDTLRLLYTRIFKLPVDKPVPNLIRQLNSRYGIGDVVHSLDESVYNFRVGSTPYWDAALDCCMYDVHTRPVTFGYRTSDKPRVVTYSDIFPDLINDPHFVDYFLFGIPQNRSLVNKIQKLRRYFAKSNDNWLHSVDSYLYHLQLFDTKTFSNNLRSIYENYEKLHNESTWTPQSFVEYYPSIQEEFPKHIGLLTSDNYDRLELLLTTFSLSVIDFYDDSGNYSVSDPREQHYYYRYYNYLNNYYTTFKTKREYNASKCVYIS